MTQELIDIIDPKDIVIGQDLEYEDVTFFTDGITKKWSYTIHDAWMGRACVGDLPPTPYNNDIQKYMNKFKDNSDNSDSWDIIYARGYKKMVNTGAIWNKNGGMSISGLECNSGYKSSLPYVNCYSCNNKNCHSSCKCKTSFNEDESFYQ